MTRFADSLIQEILDAADSTRGACELLRNAALDLLNEVNYLEHLHPEIGLPGREWHIARYEPGPQPLRSWRLLSLARTPASSAGPREGLNP